MYKLWVTLRSPMSACCSTRKKSAFYPICPQQQPLWYLCCPAGSIQSVGILCPGALRSPGCWFSAWKLSPCTAGFPKNICFICSQLIGKACSFPLQWEFESCQVGERWLVMIWMFIKSSLIQNSWVKYITATLSHFWTISQISTSDTTSIFPLNCFFEKIDQIKSMIFLLLL